MPYHEHPGLAARGVLAGPSNLDPRNYSELDQEKELSRIKREIEEAQRRFRRPPELPLPPEISPETLLALRKKLAESQVLSPEPPKKIFNEISHPAHYCRGGIECRHVIDAWGLSYNLGTALSYICRAYHKGAPDKDIAKAIQHLQFELEILRRNQAGSIGNTGNIPYSGSSAEAWSGNPKGATTCSRHLKYMPGA
jgi:hypothetical protein